MHFNQKSLLSLISFNLVILLGLMYWLYTQNQPVNIVDAPPSANQKLSCVSYAPYYTRGTTPFKAGTVISHAQIDSDLLLLSKRFECVRIYSVGEGLDYVPQAAQKLGLKVLLGVWIGWIPLENERELKLGIALANQYPDTVKALIVGNEVLLRGEQSEASMKSYIARAKKEAKVPVTYADVWEFWIKHKSLEQSVDFVTVHILPYWENHPQPIDHAIDHATNIMHKLGTIFSKPILIGETGWPSMGRQRAESKPSLINQARYLREFLVQADKLHWNYNVIEAMDQPWKRDLEGTVGGYWGIYNSDLQPKFAFDGPVAELQNFNVVCTWAGLGLLVGMIVSLVTKTKGWLPRFGLSLLGANTAVWAVLVIDYLYSACRDNIEWVALGSVAIIAFVTLLSIAYSVVKYTDEAANLLRFGFLLLLVSALTTSALILLDGRYRDFPVMLFGMASLQMAISMYVTKASIRPQWKFYKLFNALNVLLAAGCYVQELHNASALAWFIITLLLAISTWSQSVSKAST